MLPEYTFLPWLRQGLAAEIATEDRLGADPDAGPVGRPTLDVELTLDRTPIGGAAGGSLPSVRRDVAILGPGDITAIRAEAILRNHPDDGTTGAAPNELAYVEFYDEDFPWRYTPAHPAGGGLKLRPWLALLVLEPDEFELRRRADAPDVIALAGTAPLPDPAEIWAWAHGQLGDAVVTGGVAAYVRANPDHALARLIAPRKLEQDRQYHAFLVPAFEAGRAAGLGLDPSVVPVQKPAWGTAAFGADRRLPVYHAFSFQTGDAGAFETLALKLQPHQAGQEFGKRPLDVSEPGYGLTRPPGAQVGLEGALAPFDLARDAYAHDAPLQGILDAGELRRAGAPADLVVVPPAYARWQAGVPKVADAASDATLSWLAELNLDLRNRAVAGLGVEVLRARMDEYVQRAWEQVGRIEEANKRLREAELARSAAATIFDKHVVPAGDASRVLILTSAAQSGLALADDTRSIRGAVDASRVPAAAQAPAFRRITRPQRPLMKRMPGNTDAPDFQRGMLDAMNQAPGSALSAAPPAPEPLAGVALQSVRDAVAASLGALQAKPASSGRLFIDVVNEELQIFVKGGGDVDALAEATFRSRVKLRIDGRYPPGSSQDDLDLATRAKKLADAIVDLHSDAPSVVVAIEAATFVAEWGKVVRGKAFGALQVLNTDAPADAPLSRMTAEDDVKAFQSSLGVFDSQLVGGRPDPEPPAPLSAPGGLASHVLGVLHPVRTIGDRVVASLPGVDRDADDPQRLAPVMAYPEFPDPMFEPLRQLSQDHVIPNVSDLPRESLTLMEPNGRFIESYLAGVNHAFAQELLWREYPTDQRSSSFRVFWDTRDALDEPGRTDVPPLDQWSGALGDQSKAADEFVVLVVRGELLERFPYTYIYAQEALRPAAGAPRVLKPDGEVIAPFLHAKLQPDITIVGFRLSEEKARGGATGDGFFFVFLERPGQVRFGMDEVLAPHGRQTWSDLAWPDVRFAGANPHISLAANAGLAPALPVAAVWGRSSADMASILFQDPVLVARHASEMLP